MLFAQGVGLFPFTYINLHLPLHTWAIGHIGARSVYRSIVYRAIALRCGTPEHNTTILRIESNGIRGYRITPLSRGTMVKIILAPVHAGTGAHTPRGRRVGVEPTRTGKWTCGPRLTCVNN